MAENIARALRAELSPEEKKRVRKVPTENLEAYDLYSRALSISQGLMPGDLGAAANLCEEAIDLDPDFSQAVALLSHCHLLTGFYASRRPSDLLPRVESAAHHALDVDPACGEAHAALAAFNLFYERDLDAVEREVERALALHADNFLTYSWKALRLLFLGLPEEAEREMRSAMVSDPLSPGAYHTLGQILALGGNPAEAIRIQESALRLWPDIPLLHLWTAIPALYESEMKLSLEHVERAIDLAGPLPFFECVRGTVLGFMGREEEAHAILESLRARSLQEDVDPYNLFALSVAFQGLDAALPHLHEMFEVHSLFLPYLTVVPRFEPLRGDPRFREALDRICT